MDAGGTAICGIRRTAVRLRLAFFGQSTLDPRSLACATGGNQHRQTGRCRHGEFELLPMTEIRGFPEHLTVRQAKLQTKLRTASGIDREGIRLAGLPGCPGRDSLRLAGGLAAYDRLIGFFRIAMPGSSCRNDRRGRLDHYSRGRASTADSVADQVQSGCRWHRASRPLPKPVAAPEQWHSDPHPPRSSTDSDEDQCLRLVRPGS